MKMVCKYCGRELKHLMGGLYASGPGKTCDNSSSKKHVLASSSSMKCRYCGRELKHLMGGLYASGPGKTCDSSTNKKHVLS